MIDPRASLLALYEAWVRVPPHHPGRRVLVSAAIRRCKAAIRERQDILHSRRTMRAYRVVFETRAAGR